MPFPEIESQIQEFSNNSKQIHAFPEIESQIHPFSLKLDKELPVILSQRAQLVQTPVWQKNT